MLACREATQLISRKLDGKLSPRQGLLLRMHLRICAACRAYQRQAQLLGGLLRSYFHGEQPVATGLGVALSEQSRQRIRNAIERATR